MRLVIDGRRLTAARTGVGRYLESLLEEWAVDGLPLPEGVLVLKDGSGLERVPRINGLECVVLGERWPGLLWERWALGRVLRAGDLLFAPANLVPACWVGTTVLAIQDTIQEVLPESFPWHVRMRFARRYRRAAQSANRILVPSDSTRRDVERFYGVSHSQIEVIHPGPDPELRPLDPGAPLVRQAREALGLGDAPYFLFLGKRSKRRNVPVICQAFDRHRREFPAHRLVFAGPATPRELGAARDSDRGILLAGHVSEPILRGLLAGAVALLYPSLYEGFGLPVVEAMASGCPVVTLANSALVEVGGKAVLYVQEPDADSLAGAMKRLSSDPSYRANLAGLGIEQAARFSRPSFARAVGHALQSVASEASRPTMAGERAVAVGASRLQ
jgi:glycosyltransferase involved in cell wall biosynthesis